MSDTPESEDRATIRRAPKLSMFLLMGGALGAIVTFILTAIRPVDPLVGFGPLLGYFMLYGIPAGVFVGAMVGLILDRRSRRHVTGVSVAHESVVLPEPESGPGPVVLDAEPIEPRPNDADSTGTNNTER